MAYRVRPVMQRNAVPGTNSPDALRSLDGRGVEGDRTGAPARIGAIPHARPRERLDRDGPTSLTDAELIALVLRSGGRGCDAEKIARAILDRFDGGEALSEARLDGLLEVPGLGPAKAASLLAALELGRRRRGRSLERGQKIQGPMDVDRHFRSRLAEWRRESFHACLLDGRHRLIALEMISLGTLTASLVHPREVFCAAIERAAAAILLVHNHPSGDPSPSREDREVTIRLEAAGELMGIRVLDHVIVASGGYFSFREEDPTLFAAEASRMAGPSP